MKGTNEARQRDSAGAPTLRPRRRRHWYVRLSVGTRQEVVSMPVTAGDLSKAMSKRLASYKLTDAAIKRLADRLIVDGLDIMRFDPCIYGICVDYWTRELPKTDLDVKSGIVKWEVFPYGILVWDLFHVRVAYEVNELEGKVTPRGF
jgi:hypothetical protein